MRIAVSGTHGVGKTTLIEEFLSRHPEFAHEPEPYTVLVEDYGEEFASEPKADDFYRQLEYNLERLRCNRRGERVIYDRSPVDFLAYILSLKDLKADDVNSVLLKRVVAMVSEGLQKLDLLVFLPLDIADEDGPAEPENPRLRRTVDSRLVDIFSGDEFGFFSSGDEIVLEARGSTTQRLRILEEALEQP
jgi:AAA domain